MNFKINNHNWQLIEEQNGDNVYLNDRGECRWGLTNYNKQTIFIHKDTHPEKKKTIFVHELAHAFIEEYGFYPVVEEKNVSHEVLADFISKYSEMIIDIANTFYPINEDTPPHKSKSYASFLEGL